MAGKTPQPKDTLRLLEWDSELPSFGIRGETYSQPVAYCRIELANGRVRPFI
jgi:hypothetical protein